MRELLAGCERHVSNAQRDYDAVNVSHRMCRAVYFFGGMARGDRKTIGMSTTDGTRQS
jgi:hypothetical protein